MRINRKAVFFVAVGVILPAISYGQTIANEMRGLHQVLEQLYEEMMPLYSKLTSVGQGIAGFAATWYIASRVWRHLANAEPIDFYPLFRPFVLGFCIMLFPSVLAVINGVMKPVVTATSAMVDDSDKAIRTLLEQKEVAIKKTRAWQMYVGESGIGNRDEWYKYTYDNADPEDEGVLDGLGNDLRFVSAKLSYSFRNTVKEWMGEILAVLFEAAALCINTLRTFQLVVLSILGPLVFALAVFDGFQHTLTVWLARYLNIYLWLPVANIFGSIIGKIQENMLKIDISQVEEYGDTFFSATDVAYLVFMVIGIIGYFTVPSVANYIVHAGGGGGLTQKVTGMFASSSRTTMAAASTGAGMVADTMGNAANKVKNSMSSSGMSSGYFNEGEHKNNSSGYMNNKLSGN